MEFNCKIRRLNFILQTFCHTLPAVDNVKGKRPKDKFNSPRHRLLADFNGSRLTVKKGELEPATAVTRETQKKEREKPIITNVASTSESLKCREHNKLIPYVQNERKKLVKGNSLCYRIPSEGKFPNGKLHLIKSKNLSFTC